MIENDSLAPKPSASQILLASVIAAKVDTLTVDDLAAALDHRAFGVALMLVGLVNCVPLPPVISTLMGVPVFIVGIQLLIGRHTPWLPGIIRRRAFKRTDLLRVLRRIGPYLHRIERFARPRMPFLERIVSPHLVGLMVVLLSLFIMTPMVFTNIPPAMATVFLGIALIEEDGLLLPIGLVVAILAMTLSTALATGAIAVMLIAAVRIFGLN